jgi:hypothetical protein
LTGSWLRNEVKKGEKKGSRELASFSGGGNRGKMLTVYKGRGKKRQKDSEGGRERERERNESETVMHIVAVTAAQLASFSFDSFCRTAEREEGEGGKEMGRALSQSARLERHGEGTPTQVVTLARAADWNTL